MAQFCAPKGARGTILCSERGLWHNVARLNMHKPITTPTKTHCHTTLPNTITPNEQGTPPYTKLLLLVNGACVYTDKAELTYVNGMVAVHGRVDYLVNGASCTRHRAQCAKI